MNYKKIGVCNGKTCGPAGAAQIKKILKDTYNTHGIEVTERLCCGRCENNNSIVIDDDVTISHLSPGTLKERFIDRPDVAIAEAREEEKRIREELDHALEADLLS